MPELIKFGNGGLEFPEVMELLWNLCKKSDKKNGTAMQLLAQGIQQGDLWKWESTNVHMESSPNVVKWP